MGTFRQAVDTVRGIIVFACIPSEDERNGTANDISRCDGRDGALIYTWGLMVSRSVTGDVVGGFARAEEGRA